MDTPLADLHRSLEANGLRLIERPDAAPVIQEKEAQPGCEPREVARFHGLRDPSPRALVRWGQSALRDYLRQGT
jgi:hypothetical protein